MARQERLKRFGKETRIRWRASRIGRRVLRAAAVGADPVDYCQRWRAAARYNRQFPSDRMSVKDGYALLPAGTLSGTTEIVDTCRRLFLTKKAVLEAEAPTDEEASRDRRSKRSFLFNLLDDDDRRANPDLVDFALSDPLLSIVTNYFGVVPSLAGVNLIYSLPRPTPDEHISSQLFHRDPEGQTQAKVFLNIFDVDDTHGPFTFIPASLSERAVPAILRQRRRTGARIGVRYYDEELQTQGCLDAAVRLVGPTGAAAIADTSRCLHAGSRVQTGHFRLCLFLQYRVSDHQVTRSFEARRFRDDPVRWLAVRRNAVLG